MVLGVPYAKRLRKLGGEILQTVLKFALQCGIMAGKGVGCLQNAILCVGIVKVTAQASIVAILAPRVAVFARNSTTANNFCK